jgi:hypothetical protein
MMLMNEVFPLELKYKIRKRASDYIGISSSHRYRIITLGHEFGVGLLLGLALTALCPPNLYRGTGYGLVYAVFCDVGNTGQWIQHCHVWKVKDRTAAADKLTGVVESGPH